MFVVSKTTNILAQAVKPVTAAVVVPQVAALQNPIMQVHVQQQKQRYLTVVAEHVQATRAHAAAVKPVAAEPVKPRQRAVPNRQLSKVLIAAVAVNKNKLVR